jgi:stalled ribosome alternative rescue factor ArfA
MHQKPSSASYLSLKHIIMLISSHSADQLKKGWTSPVYAFFELIPSIEYVDGRRSHVFKCMGKGCKQRVRRYLDKGDAKSTSNMAKHVKSCWGPEAYEAAQDAKSAAAAREGVIRNLLRSGTITSSFERKSKGKVSYSHRQHTKTETKYVLGTSMYTNIPLTRR